LVVVGVEVEVVVEVVVVGEVVDNKMTQVDIKR
jgi:hypothetical protein